MYIPDSKQSLDQRLVMVCSCWKHVIVVVLTLAQYCLVGQRALVRHRTNCWQLSRPDGANVICQHRANKMPTKVQRIIAIWDVPVRAIWEDCSDPFCLGFFLQLIQLVIFVPLEVFFLKQKH